MSRELIIHCTKSVLVMSEKDLFTVLSLRPDIFQKALEKGKAYRRCIIAERRAEGEKVDNPWYNFDD